MEAVEAAVRYAEQYTSKAVLIEPQISGDYHRLIVVNGSLIGVLRLDPPGLIGDGVLTIADLHRNSNEDQPELSAEQLSCLQMQSLGPNNIPKKGQRVHLEFNLENRSSWRITYVLDRVDASLHRLAEGVAASLGLLNAGIDILSVDIARPVPHAELTILEVNAIQTLHPVWAPRVIDAFQLSVQSACLHAAVAVVSKGGCGPNRAEWQRVLAKIPQSQIALPRRLLRWLPDDSPFERFLIYRHPREILLNRSLDSVLFLIDWRELLTSGLPCRRLQELLLIGSIPKPMVTHWQRMLSSLTDQS
ncbi:MAG: hypothetical protein VKK63_10155 [Synechococcus sp.]|nr:hypothetical protein [Synechococcus sp.]